MFKNWEDVFWGEVQQNLVDLGPERVQRGMVAFEHKPDRQYSGMYGCDNRSQMNVCCFLGHAALPGVDYNSAEIHTAGLRRLRGRLRGSDRHILGVDSGPAVERVFELGDSEARMKLRQMCIQFLAEHGTAPEPAFPDAQLVHLGTESAGAVGA